MNAEIATTDKVKSATVCCTVGDAVMLIPMKNEDQRCSEVVSFLSTGRQCVE